MTFTSSRPGGPVSTNGPATGGPDSPSPGSHPAGTRDYSQPREPQSREAILTCGHPHSKRWLSVGGWVEVCGVCSSCRRPGVPWRDAVRWVRRVGDQLVMFGEDGLIVRRDPV